MHEVDLQPLGSQAATAAQVALVPLVVCIVCTFWEMYAQLLVLPYEYKVAIKVFLLVTRRLTHCFQYSTEEKTTHNCTLNNPNTSGSTCTSQYKSKPVIAEHSADLSQ
jgi:hypothetical protein